jgi:pyruvate kinase
MVESVIAAPRHGAAPRARGDAARDALVHELQALRQSMLAAESRLPSGAAKNSASARNLVHYLALRRHDHRGLQQRLAELGLSSLGRAEPHVLDNVDRVLQLLRAPDGGAPAPAGFGDAQALHARHVQALFGPPSAGRRTPIMVTLPSEAAGDAALIPALVHAGMDVARINCAHDDAEAWIAMALRVRQAAAAAGRTVRVLMDLAGPKLRTGPIAPGPQVLKLKPQRDAFGAVTAPARLLLCPRGCGAAAEEPKLEVDAQWLARLRDGDEIRLVDARGRKRRLSVIDLRPDGVRVQCERTAYLCADTQLAVRRLGPGAPAPRLPGLPQQPGRLHLSRGQTLHLAARGVGRDAPAPGTDAASAPATVSCTLPEVLPQLRAGEHVWFDDGRIGGVIRRVAAQGVDIEITDAAVGGETLAADKGINLPDSRLDLPALTDKDIADLTVVARHADLVGLSFVQSAEDVRALHRRLAALCADKLGVVLKIETRRGFENLPELLLAAMARGAPTGVMIARGDLAVECGFERLAEVQEEILWACEAAHMPVVWATQVLENLAKTGRPSRAEITDAAMSVRADCVMLNKGPHILDAMRTLDDILRRMQEHQAKKRPLLRALKAWS